MAYIPSAWGYGSFAIKNSSDTDYLIFNQSKSNLQFKIEGREEKNIDHTVVDIRYGYRAYLDVEILSYQATSYKDILQLIAILDTKSFDIVPYYDTEIASQFRINLDTVFYDMIELDGITIEQIHKFLELGQSMKIKFKARKLITNQRPLKHSDTANMGKVILGYDNDSGTDLTKLSYASNEMDV